IDLVPIGKSDLERRTLIIGTHALLMEGPLQEGRISGRIRDIRIEENKPVRPFGIRRSRRAPSHFKSRMSVFVIDPDGLPSNAQGLEFKGDGGQPLLLTFK